MKQLFAVIFVAALFWLALSSARADAVPACVPTNEKLTSPVTSATYNRELGTPQTDGSGLYVTDGGVQFYVGAIATIEAAPVIGATTCPVPADELTVRLADPWSGESLTLEVKGTP